MTGDLTRSLKRINFLITETNAQTIGWDSRAQFPPYPGQFRQAVYSHLAAGANMVEYWHWHSLHYGQETYWRGILSHDLEPNRIYQEMSQVAGELKRIGPQLVNLKKEPQVGILFSADASNALSYMPVGDRVTYQTVMQQMWNALYDLNIEPDFIQAGDSNLARYKVILVPPLYGASDTVLQQISDYVKEGGHVVMAFKSGFTNQFSTVRDVMAPGPLRAAAGFHYQEFTNLVQPVKLTPDPFAAGAANTADTWAELLILDTAQVLAKLDDANWKSPVITRNKYGTGTLTYEAAALSDPLQRSVIHDALSRAAILSADQALPSSIRVRHGVTQQGKRLHYYLNFSSNDATFSYSYPAATDLQTSRGAATGAPITIRSWDLAILLEY